MTQTAAEMVAEAVGQVDHASPKEAFDEVGAGQVVLLDVREPVEWEHHIQGAVQVPRRVLKLAADPASPRHTSELDPTRRGIVYCRSGVRAAHGAHTLKTLGYEDVATSTVASTPGRKPASRQTSTTRISRARR